MRSLDKKTLLEDATASGSGTEFQVERDKGWSFVVHSQDVTTTGAFLIRDDHGHYEKIRANISSYTAGTHSVFATGTVDSL